MERTVGEAMWKGTPDRLRLAREAAREMKKRGDHVGAHSEMLSAYYSIGKPKFFFFALYHALCMYGRWRDLSHNQLDVLIQFLIKLRKKLPFFPFRPNLIGLSNRAVRLVHENQARKPHQEALAWITRAEVRHYLGCKDVFWSVEAALHRTDLIKREPDQPQGLRQLVRIYKKVGELYLSIGDHKKGIGFFRRALDLARGEADAPDQVVKIEALLRDIG